MSVLVRHGGALRDVSIYVNSFDDVAPDAPTGVVALARTESVLLSWDANTETDLVGYDVYYGTSAGVTVATGTRANAVTITSETFTATGLTGDVEHYLIVVARDRSGNTSAASNEVTATPAASGAGQVTLIPGSAAGGFTGNVTPSFNYTHTLTAAAVAGDYVVVCCTIDGLNDTVSTVDAVEVYNGQVNVHANQFVFHRKLATADITNGSVVITFATSSDESVALVAFELTGVHPDTPVDVVAGDPASGSSDSSAGPVGFTAAAGTYAVAFGSADQSNLVTLATTLNGFALVLLLDPDDVATPVAHVAGLELPTAGAYSGPSYSNTADEETHAAIVVFAASGGDSTAPDPPTGLSLTEANGSIQLDWDNSLASDFDHYEVYRSTSSPVDTSTSVASVPDGDPTYLDTGFTPGVTNYYVVTAVDTSSNESSASNEESILAPEGDTGATLPTGASHDWQFANATTLTDEIGTLDIPVTGAAAVAFGLDFVQAEADICLLTTDDALDEIDHASDWTWTILCEIHASSGIAHLFCTRHNTNGTRAALQIRDGIINAVVYDQTTGTTLAVVAANVILDSPGLYTLRWNASNQTLSLARNTTEVTPVTANHYNTGGNGLAFGGSSSNAYHADAVIARSITWPRRLSSTDLNNLYEVMQAFATSRGETI